MKAKRIAVHFGGGALGRGMVVPLLHDSGYDVVIADTNEDLNRELNAAKAYPLILSDEEPGLRKRDIQILEAISPNADKDKAAAYLREASIVTTSVRRENLIHVARTLAETWGHSDAEGRLLICCENIENTGDYFKDLLDTLDLSNEQKRRLEKVDVPDTIVDRICAAAWPESTAVIGEIFYECAVDARCVPDTGIIRIPAVDRMDLHFARKRLLLNTYADAISFLALAAGKRYLYEAALDQDVNRAIEPYMDLLQKMLVLEFGCDPDELSQWRSKYRKRLSNPDIPRPLDTVARNFWTKMAMNERFVWPLIRLIEQGEDIREGARFLALLLETHSSRAKDDSEPVRITNRLRELWGNTDVSDRLLAQICVFLDA